MRCVSGGLPLAQARSGGERSAMCAVSPAVLLEASIRRRPVLRGTAFLVLPSDAGDAMRCVSEHTLTFAACCDCLDLSYKN